eukprot:scaffold2503_cov158-Ochromonas_danica.AAC.1
MHHTNICKYFEIELEKAGFDIRNEDDEGYVTRVRLENELKEDMKEMTKTINDENYKEVINAITENEEKEDLSQGLTKLKSRAEILKLDTEELMLEYRDLVEDEYKFDQFLNYSRLHKSYDHCQAKLNDTISRKMLGNVHNNAWNKIKYIHLFAKECIIENDLLNIEGIVIPENRKKLNVIINSIRTLYRKRDKLDETEYDDVEIVKLYKFMIDHMIKKLGLFSSKRIKVRGAKDSYKHTINKKEKTRLDKLMRRMNPEQNMSDEVCFKLLNDEQEEEVVGEYEEEEVVEEVEEDVDDECSICEDEIDEAVDLI